MTGIALCLAAGLMLPAAQERLENIPSGIVTVIAYDAQGQELRRGGGFFITRDGHVITARELLRGAVRAEVKAGGVYGVQGVVLEAFSANLIRLAIESPPEDGTPAVPLTGTTPKVGERVTLATDGSAGVVRAVRDIPALGRVLRIEGSIPPVAAATPVLNSQGEGVGVALWEAAGMPGTSFAIAAESVPVEVFSNLRTLEEWDAAAAKDFAATAHADYIEGLSQLFVDHFDDALAGFEQAIRKNPLCAEAWFHMGFTYAKMGQQQRKIESYREAIRVKPDYAAARYSLGVSYALAGEGELARAEHEALKKIDPPLAERLELLIGAIVHTEHEEETGHASEAKSKK